MGDPETAAPMRDAVQAFVGPGRGVGISVLDVNALFPAGTRIGERVAELAAAAQQPHGMARLAGLQRVAAMPSDPDGLFVGRDQARADLQRLLGAEHRHGSVRTIFLTGPSGVGKSALARTLAKDCLHEKAWATAYYVDLGGCHTMAEAAQRMCAAFQVGCYTLSSYRAAHVSHPSALHALGMPQPGLLPQPRCLPMYTCTRRQISAQNSGCGLMPPRPLPMLVELPAGHH